MKQSTILASLLAVVALTSCGTMHDAAVSTFRVVDAPHQYVRRQLGVDEPQQQTTTTTTETYSDTSSPPSQPYPVQQPYATQQPPPPPPPVQTQRRVVATEREAPPEPESRPTATPRVTTTRESVPPTTTSTQRTASSQGSDLPYAKPVPGKPGYVFSPFDKNGGYVDVTGYSPGQKVKDPYSGKIFLVP